MNPIPTFLRAAALALAVLAVPAQPLAAQGRLAVLEFTGKDVDASILAAMTERARAAALDPTRKYGYEVMTKQSTSLILQEMGGACVEGQCEIELARSVGAGLLLTGEVRKTKVGTLADLKLHDTAKGTLVGVETLEGKDEFDVLRMTRDATERLLDAGFRRFLEIPVAMARPAAQGEQAPPPFKRPKWMNWMSPGWNVGAAMDVISFKDGPLSGKTGAPVGLRVGWGVLGVQAGQWLPGNYRMISADVLREAGIGDRIGEHWSFAVLVPSLELRYIRYDTAALPRKSAAAPAAPGTTGESLATFDVAVTGARVTYRKAFLSFHGPIYTSWNFDANTKTSTWSWALSTGVTF